MTCGFCSRPVRYILHDDPLFWVAVCICGDLAAIGKRHDDPINDVILLEATDALEKVGNKRYESWYLDAQAELTGHWSIHLREVV